MPQLSIQNDPAPSFSGQVAYPMKTFIDPNTRFVQQVGGISFGRFVTRNADQTVKLPTLATDITNALLEGGIAQRQEFSEQNGVGYADGEPITIVQTGYVWVEVEGNVTSGAQAFVRFAAGAGGGAAFIGRFRGDADTATAAAHPNARFDTGNISGLAIVRLGV